MFTEVKNIPTKMVTAARKLKEGPILIVYNDSGKIRCETERGIDPYVWRKDKWVKMKG